MIALLIALGAAVGAPARYLTDRAVQARHDTRFPWGSLTINVVASLMFGVLVGVADGVSDEMLALLGTGFCGALSTFSTFSFETVRLIEDRARCYAVANVVVSLAAGLGAAALGWSIGGALH